MPAITSKVQICAMALSHMGVYEILNDIDTPTSDKEVVFSLWYDITRQVLLRRMIPHFATKRANVGLLAETPLFGFSHVYQAPSGSLRILGVGNVEDKENTVTVEDGKLYTDEYVGGPMPVRYIADVTDVTKFTPDFILQLSWELAANTCMAITQDPQKAAAIVANIDKLALSSAATMAQENRPIKKRMSKFKASRYTSYPVFEEKK